MFRFLSSSIRRMRIFEALCLMQGIHCPISNKPRDAILIYNIYKQLKRKGFRNEINCGHYKFCVTANA